MNANLALSFLPLLDVGRGRQCPCSLRLLRVICFVASRAQRMLPCIICLGLEWLGPGGPLPARMAYRSVCGTRVLFAVFGRRHGLLPGTLVLETATDCCWPCHPSPLVNRTYVHNYFGSSSSSICISSVMLLANATYTPI